MKYIYIFLGVINLILGVIGISVPLLPTTPFLLLAFFFFHKSSEKLSNWLLNTKYLGVYIKNYKEKSGIPFYVKLISLLILWTTIIYSVIFIINTLWLRLLLLLIAFIVSIHVINIKTKK